MATDEFKILLDIFENSIIDLQDDRCDIGEWERNRYTQAKNNLLTAYYRLKFSPLGDNHHNALLCPYCNPNMTTLTPKQKELKKAHGTVNEFTDAIINAIGEISVVEAQKAIADYREQWNNAGVIHAS